MARGDDRYEMKREIGPVLLESEVCMAVNLKMTSGLEGDEKLLLTTPKQSRDPPVLFILIRPQSNVNKINNKRTHGRSSSLD